MKVCLKNLKYLFYNKSINEFGYYVGNCYIENGMITGFGNEDQGFDQVYDMTNKLAMPMLTNIDCNLEDIIFRKLQSNWDTTKFSSLENTMGQILTSNNKDYYEDIAPMSLFEIINTGTGLIGTRRCYKAISEAPCYAFCHYPVSRSLHLRHLINQPSIDAYIGSNTSPNIIHGFELRSLYDCDDGSLSLIRDNMKKVKYIKATIGMNDLMSNVVKQKWLKDELQVLNTYNLLHKNTILCGCNNLNEKDIKRIKDVDATVVYTPLMSRALNCPQGNMLACEDEGVLWCIASGSPSSVDCINMFYVIQETSRMFPALRKDLIFKAATINPAEALNKILNVDITNQANFTVIDAPYDFSDPNSVFEYLFSKNPYEMQPILMLNGTFVTYQKENKAEDQKNILRSYYKRFDQYAGNPNMFVTEVPQKP